MNYNCRICGGSGVIEKSGSVFECDCSFVRRLASAMPAFIRKAEVRNEHIQLPIIKSIKQNSFVISSWADMKSVIKAIMIANHQLFIKVSSDREIRDVFVGTKSRAARGDEEGQVYNSLEDLMDSPNLMIIRLNELSYKNKAAPGALEEAICYRLDRDKPSWLFSDYEKPFSVGSHAYSDSVANIIQSNFQTVKIPRILTNVVSSDFFAQNYDQSEPAQTQTQIELVKEPDLDTIEEVKPKIQKQRKIRPSEDIDADTGLSAMYGSGLTKKNSFKKGRQQ